MIIQQPENERRAHVNKYAELQIFKLKVACFLLTLMLLAHLAGCSTANNWKPQYTLPDPKYVQVCEQHGSKLYDRDTGKECLTHEQQRRKDAQGVHHAGAPR